MPTFEASRAGYRNLWAKTTVERADDADRAAKDIVSDKERYLSIERETGVPWFWTAITHLRESGRSFAGVLHNGERIIGTGKKTRLVPKGRGPFSSWNEAAVDALKLKGLDKVDDWSVERILFEWERYNGFGYVGKINSPYVWAGTNLQQRGKFVADHKFDPSHWDTQLGTAAVLKRLAEMDKSVSEAISKPSDGPDDTGLPPGMSQYTNDQLIGELLTRENVKQVTIAYESRGFFTIGDSKKASGIDRS